MAPKIELAQAVTSADAPAPPAQKPPVDPATLAHRDLLGGEFWRAIPAYAEIGAAEFLDHKWQAKHSITNIPKLLATLSGLVSEAFVADAQRGFERAPMSVRVSPYLLSLIDWTNPYEDPLRTQFIPLGSRLLPDHPRLDLDSLARARRHAGPRASPTATSTRRSSSRSTPARSTAASARAATRSASTPRRWRSSSSR